MYEDLNTTSSDLDFSTESVDTSIETVSEVIDSPDDFPEDVTALSNISEIDENETEGLKDVIPENIGDDFSDATFSSDILDATPESHCDDVPDDISKAFQDNPSLVDSQDAKPDEQYDNIPEDVNAEFQENSSSIGILDVESKRIPDEIPEDVEDVINELETQDVEPENLNENMLEDIGDVPTESNSSIEVLDTESDESYDKIPEDIETEIPNDSNISEIVGAEAEGTNQAGLEDISIEEESPYSISDTLSGDDSYYHAVPNSDRDIEPAIEPYHAIPLSESIGSLVTDNIGLEETGSEEDDQNQFLDEGNNLIPHIATDDKIQESTLNPDSDLETDSYASDEQFSSKIDEIINNENLTKEQKEDILLDIRSKLLDAQDAEIDAASSDIINDDSSILSLKRDESLLLDQGYRNIQDILDVRADDYRDQGYSEDDITTLLAQDKIALQKEFLRDAFPEQDVSPDVFNSFEIESPTKGDHITDVQSISDIENWLGDINPNFDAFDPESPYCNNCGSCAYAVYQRLEGSTDSCASAENIGYNSQMNALTGMEQVSMSPEAIQERLLAEGDGAHAIIGIDRAEGPGHWFNAACIDGKVVAIDGQTGEITDWPPDYGDVVNWEMSIKKGA